MNDRQKQTVLKILKEYRTEFSEVEFGFNLTVLAFEKMESINKVLESTESNQDIQTLLHEARDYFKQALAKFEMNRVSMGIVVCERQLNLLSQIEKVFKR